MTRQTRFVKTDRPGCPHPTKHAFATEEAAEREALARTFKLGETYHSYQCQCTWWHLTTQTGWKLMTPPTATSARPAAAAPVAKTPVAPRTLPAATSVTTAQYTITPAIAEHWLATYNTHNRPIRDRFVDQLASAITRGEWIPNGDTIRFSHDHVLRDGQHRLAAVRQANKAIDAIVVTGLAPESQTTMDVGARRTFADVLRLDGETDALSLAAACTRVHQWKIGEVRAAKTRPSHTQLLALLDEYPGIRDAIPHGRRLNKQLRLATSIGAFTWWLLAPLDMQDAAFFFDRLTDGVGLDEGSPILALRQSLIKNSQARAKLPDHVMLALFIKAWNAYRQGRKVQILAWKSGGATPEAFPEPA